MEYIGKFKCEFCDYSTNDYKCLRRHIISNHEIGGSCVNLTPKNRMFKCDKCTFCGRGVGGLASHKKIHEK